MFKLLPSAVSCFFKGRDVSYITWTISNYLYDGFGLKLINHSYNNYIHDMYQLLKRISIKKSLKIPKG